jgi:hypothetical protein
MLYMGIDPDVDKSGVAIWDSSANKLTDLKCLDFFDTIIMINHIGKCRGQVIIEGGWLNMISNFHDKKGASIRERIAKNVGENHAIGKLFEMYCKKYSVRYLVVKPERSKELTNLIFRNTKWSGTSNQEMRDAAGLVIGK